MFRQHLHQAGHITLLAARFSGLVLPDQFFKLRQFIGRIDKDWEPYLFMG